MQRPWVLAVLVALLFVGCGPGLPRMSAVSMQRALENDTVALIPIVAGEAESMKDQKDRWEGAHPNHCFGGAWFVFGHPDELPRARSRMNTAAKDAGEMLAEGRPEDQLPLSSLAWGRPFREAVLLGQVVRYWDRTHHRELCMKHAEKA